MTGNSSSTSQCLVLDALPQETQEHEGLLLALSTALPWAISVVLHIGLFLILFFAVATMTQKVVGATELGGVMAIPTLSETTGTHNRGPGDPKLPPAQDLVRDLTATGFSMGDSDGQSVYLANSDDKKAIHSFGQGTGTTRITGLGGGDAGGRSGRRAPFGKPGGDFFGVTVPSWPDGGEPVKNICYVIDRSGSMLETFDYVTKEMQRSINSLHANQYFHAIFFSSGTPVENPPKMLVPATPANKQQVEDFLREVTPVGQTDPTKAMERAFQVTNDKGEKAQLIYMLTDGEFSTDCVKRIRLLNSEHKVRINTIAFISDEGRPQLEAIAKDNGGKFKFVTRDMLGN